MKGYKAFGKGLVCRGKQYKENTVFEEEKAVICNSGMHFCKNPLDVLDYYPLIDNNGDKTEFAEVEALDEVLTDDNKKFCTKKLKINGKISFMDFIKGAFSITYNNIKSEVDEETKEIEKGGYNSTLAGGYNSTLAGGDDSIIVGDNGSIAKGGIGSVITLVVRDLSGHIVDFRAAQIDGKNLKADTWYKLESGEFVEVNL